MQRSRIVVPCYNEAHRLKPLVFLKALEKDPSLSFLFVNEGSRERTLEILNSIKESNGKQVAILNLKENSGKAEAVRCRILSALEEPCDYVGLLGCRPGYPTGRHR